ncbi:MAG: SPOR domain-containing protein [Rhodobacterales bacterium]
MSKFLNILTSIASIIALSLLVWWGISLSQLDPNDIPVIKKTQGPARTAPENPGGKQANFQGLSVNEIQSAAGISKPVNKIFNNNTSGLELVIREKIKPDAGESYVGIKSEQNSNVNLLNESGYLGPKMRPEGLQLSTDDKDLKSSQDVAVGTVVVQLGAFDFDAVAVVQMDNLSKSHADLLGDKELFIQKANNGSKEFYRLRVKGFKSTRDAKSFCTAITARGNNCIPVMIR